MKGPTHVSAHMPYLKSSVRGQLVYQPIYLKIGLLAWNRRQFREKMFAVIVLIDHFTRVPGKLQIFLHLFPPFGNRVTPGQRLVGEGQVRNNFV